jgi:hypothetical protein
MDKYKLMDMIYDKLADNTSQEQFEPSMAEDMCVANDWQDDGEPKIAIVIDDVEYVLSIKANGKNEREFYEAE